MGRERGRTLRERCYCQTSATRAAELAPRRHTLSSFMIQSLNLPAFFAYRLLAVSERALHVPGTAG